MEASSQIEIGDDLRVRLTGWAEPVYAGELSPELLRALEDARLDLPFRIRMAAPAKKKGLAAPSQRLEAIPPYMFAELERRIEAKRDEGIDVISLGIGDPDTPTFRYIVEAMREAVGDPRRSSYPSNRGRRSSARRSPTSTCSASASRSIPLSEVIPAIGAKECIYNLCFAFLDPGDVALASDPGYPVYTSGPVLAGAEAHLLPLRADLGFAPDLDAISDEKLDAARLLFINYPNNPTGAIVPEGFFERVVELARAPRDPRRP